VQWRKHFALGRLDSCVLSWNELQETQNVPNRTEYSYTYTVSLGRIGPDQVTSGLGITFRNPNTTPAVTMEMLAWQNDVGYRYTGLTGQWRRFNWLFASFYVPSNAEAIILQRLREIIDTCRPKQ
jgi:hypothetical protein